MNRHLKEAEMAKNTDNTFVLIRNSKGGKLLCPVDAHRNLSAKSIDANDDCVEEDVVGRYAGNITINHA